MKCLVTGGKGFIGSHLVNFLKSEGHFVRNVDVRAKSYLATQEDEFLQLDLRESPNAEKAVAGMDFVYTLAANMGGIGWITEVNAAVMRDNALININMAEASLHAGVKRHFFSSSACAYNHLKQEDPLSPALKETDAVPAWPDSRYGWEKLFTEFLLKSYLEDHGLDIRIARYHNVYGPEGTYQGGREKAPAAICRKVAEAHDGSTITLWGDGKQTRSFLFINDCLDATYALMNSGYTEPVNIGSDILISVDDLAKLVMRIAGKTLRVDHDVTKPQGVRGRNADLTLVSKTLGWRPKISYEEGMATTYRWIEAKLNE